MLLFFFGSTALPNSAKLETENVEEVHMNSEQPILKAPLQLKDLTLRNRLVLPPMATGLSKGEANVAQKYAAYCGDKSADQALGMITVEHMYVLPSGKAALNQLGISNDDDVADLVQITKAVHANQTPLFAQISHAGARAKENEIGSLPLSPSLCADKAVKVMDQQDIDEVIEGFKQAARRAKEAGFDGVEIHSAHGYLLDQFYSPLTNTRTDEYGGSLENRIRLHRQIIQAVREAVGNDFPVSLRLGACDYMDGGATVEDGAKAAAIFEKDGIDLISVSGGLCGPFKFQSKEPGYFKDASSAIKKVVEIPVLLTGGVTTGKQAEELLEEDSADLIGVGRAELKDSHWAKKQLEAL